MRRIKSILAKNWLILTIFIAGIFLRFYNFSGFVTFLGDQGRDAIIIKRILYGQHFPAIGAPTSVGQVYLGPFYYYFIAPWLLIFHFNPLGLAVGVAIFSCAFILINYFIVKELFDDKTALISSFLIAFSYVLIDLSRFSWNPNLLPLFSLLTIYFFIKAIKTGYWKFYLLFGAFLAFSIQLHYLALSLLLPILILSLPKLFSNFLKFLGSAAIFLFFSTPLLIFDLRHQFLNTRNFLALFKESSSVKANILKNFFDTFSTLNFYIFNTKFSFWINIVLIFVIVAFLVSYVKRKKDQMFNFGLIFILSTFVLSLYSGPKYLHYLGVLYPFYLVVIAGFLANLFNNIGEKLLIVFFLVAFVALNYQGYTFFHGRGSDQIRTAEDVARKIFVHVDKPKYTVTGLPDKYSDSTYRYFLEIWGKAALEKDSLEKADELFVVCDSQCTPIIGNPQWEIAYFAPTKIVANWKVDGVRIYELVNSESK